MQNVKNIMLFSLFPAINSTGGVEKVLFSMANKLVEFGYGVSVVFYDGKKGNIVFPVDDSILLYDLADKPGKRYKLSPLEKVLRIFKGNQNARHTYEEKLEGEYLANKLMPIIEKDNPVLAISFNIFGAKILYKYANFNKPIISMQHGEPIQVLDKITDDSIDALEHCAINQVLLKSYIDKNVEITNIDRKKFVNIPNAIQQFHFNKNDRKNIIISVATVDERKQQYLLIQAFNMIKDKYPEWNVELWGMYSEKDKYYLKCSSLINKYGLQHRIKFMGTTQNISEVFDYAKIIALVSRSEAFSLAIAEGMSAGLVGIGLKSCAGVNEEIEDGINGFLCKDTPEGIALNLEKLMSDKTLLNKMSLQAHESMKKYSPDIVWNKWKILINNILEDSTSKSP